MSRKKSNAKAKEAKPEGSEIIKQAVIYVQQMSAYDAGFSVDLTGDSEYAGKSDEIKKAHRAMCKLIGLSPLPGGTALSPIELHAKAAVLAAMYGLRKDEEPDETERAYIRFFAREVVNFLAANHAEGT
jgi:hypothetical protein